MQIMRESYTRIELRAGGAADRRRIYAPCIEAAAYLTDARGEVLTQREDNEGLSRLCPSSEKIVCLQDQEQVQERYEPMQGIEQDSDSGMRDPVHVLQTLHRRAEKVQTGQLTLFIRIDTYKFKRGTYQVTAYMPVNKMHPKTIPAQKKRFLAARGKFTTQQRARYDIYTLHSILLRTGMKDFPLLLIP